jgi:hypothetical protein
MNTYLIAREIAITRQEGNVANVVITVPDLFPMEGRSAIFEVTDQTTRTLFKKTESDGLTISGQIITVSLEEKDTDRRVGMHHWKLRATGGEGIVDIGNGPFIVVKV